MDESQVARLGRCAPWVALALVPASVLIVAVMQREPTLLPGAWGCSGFLLGALLGLDGHQRRAACLFGGVSTTLTLFATGTPGSLAVALGVLLVLEVRIAQGVLLRRTDRFELSHRDDIARLVGATALAAGVSTLLLVGYLVAFAGEPLASIRWLALLVFATHAASLTALLPFFVPSQRPVDPANPVAFTAWASLLLGLTILIFTAPGTPPALFAVMPIFAWLAFRAPLPWAASAHVVVGATAVAFTLGGVGPFVETVVRFGRPAELAPTLLNLFLLNCALIMYPVAVITSERARAAQAAHQDRARLAGVLDGASSVGIIATDCEGAVVLFSEGAVRLTGIAAEDALARRVDQLGMPFAGDDQPEGSATRPLWHLTRPDGAERVLAVAIRATKDHEGRSDGHVITLEDRTEQRAAHQATKTALAREKELVAHLEELDHVKDTFVATVSHELRTPVTSISGYLEMLADGDVGRMSEEQLMLLQRVTRNSRRLQVLIEDLLLLSRIESRALTLQPERIDVREIARDVALRFSDGSRETCHEIRLEASEPAWMHGDRAQLERVVGILVDNAVKFSPGGQPVELRLRASDKLVELRVSDSGVGIPFEEQAGLFTPFFRSSVSHELATQGAGMGLAIAKAVCAAHGGSIQVDSSPAEGTRVCVVLPVAGPSSQTTEAATAALPSQRTNEAQAV